MRRRSPRTCRRRRSRPTAASWRRWWRPTFSGRTPRRSRPPRPNTAKCGPRTPWRWTTTPPRRRPPLKLTPFTEPPQTTNAAGLAAPGGRGSAKPRAPRPAQCAVARVDTASRSIRCRGCCRLLANLTTDYTNTLNGLLNSLFGPAGASTYTACLQRRQDSAWLHHRVQRHRVAHQLPGVAVPQVRPHGAGGWRDPKRGPGGRTWIGPRTGAGARCSARCTAVWAMPAPWSER